MPEEDASDNPKEGSRYNAPTRNGVNRWLSPEVAAAQKFLGTSLVDKQHLMKLAGLSETNGAIGKLIASLVPNTRLSATYSEMLSRIGTLNLLRPSPPTETSPNTAYSEGFTSADDYFTPHERVINNFDELHRTIRDLIDKQSSLQFLWRGQQDASWGLHSSLYRRLINKHKVRPADKRHRSSEPYPTEDDMVAAEEAILELARVDWRFDHLSALETFARLQHFGAPTRLIDVSRNPYIAAWFAVESCPDLDDTDGRLFAAARYPVLPPEKQPTAEALTQVRGELAGEYDPFWHHAEDAEARAQLEWGTGTIRRFWVPPLYEQRILAQNGGFLLDGVPIGVQQNASYFRRAGKGHGSWKKADLLASGSVFTKLYSPTRTVQMNKQRSFPPTFTFRITAEAKRDIRQVLEDRFSYNASTIYPDVEGLASHLRSHLDELLDRRP